MPSRYCPNCRKNVLTERADIDVGLAIFLFCCTGSIGFWIYLIIYLVQPEDHCVFCNTKTLPFNNQSINAQNQYNQYTPNNPNNPSGQPLTYNQARPTSSIPGPVRMPQNPPAPRAPLSSPPMQNNPPEMIIDENTGEMIGSTGDLKFCPICGTQFRPGAKFCSGCGSDLSAY